MQATTMLIGRVALCSGRAFSQNNRFLIYRSSSLQYYPGNSGISTAQRWIFSNASSYIKQTGLIRPFIRKRCTGPPSNSSAGAAGNSPDQQKQTLFQRFKTMWKDYWYVMIPCHIVTSIGWFGAFYKVADSELDLGYYLTRYGVSEKLVKHITDSGMGNIAIAWALYKIATPARYAVTLGGTTLSINVLRNMGYIKPANVLMAKGRNKMKSLKDKQFPTKD